ncbi:hypothetical protein AOLI_G00119550 [Acnodon oligacanthus]
MTSTCCLSSSGSSAFRKCSTANSFCSAFLNVSDKHSCVKVMAALQETLCMATPSNPLSLWWIPQCVLRQLVLLVPVLDSQRSECHIQLKSSGY